MGTLHAVRSASLPSSVVASVLVGISLVASTEALAITFGGGGEFAWTSPLIEKNGTAHVVNTADGSVLRLVDGVISEAGSGFFMNPYVLGENTDFTSRFTFRISSSPSNPLTNRSDGLAFVIAGSPFSLGGGGGGMGYGGLSPLVPSLAVEFDVHQNGFDSSDRHIGVMTNGDESIHLDQADVPIAMDNGDLWEALIRYFGQGDLLVVTLTDLSQPEFTSSLSYQIDIPELMGCGIAGCVNSYFGLTAGTGAGYATHDVVNWDLWVPEPDSLSLLAISMAALVGTRPGRFKGQVRAM